MSLITSPLLMARICLTKEVVVYGLQHFVLIDPAIVVGVIAIFQALP